MRTKDSKVDTCQVYSIAATILAGYCSHSNIHIVALHYGKWQIQSVSVVAQYHYVDSEDHTIITWMNISMADSTMQGTETETGFVAFSGCKKGSIITKLETGKQHILG